MGIFGRQAVETVMSVLHMSDSCHAGSLSLFALLLPWAFGALTYFATIYALWKGHVVIGTLLCCVIAFPYFLPNERIEWWTEFLMKGM
jgi:hypothetical protein